MHHFSQFNKVILHRIFLLSLCIQHAYFGNLGRTHLEVAGALLCHLPVWQLVNTDTECVPFMLMGTHWNT